MTNTGLYSLSSWASSVSSSLRAGERAGERLGDRAGERLRERGDVDLKGKDGGVLAPSHIIECSPAWTPDPHLILCIAGWAVYL